MPADPGLDAIAVFTGASVAWALAWLGLVSPIGVFSLLAALACRRLAPDVGNEVSGHVARRA